VAISHEVSGSGRQSAAAHGRLVLAQPPTTVSGLTRPGGRVARGELLLRRVVGESGMLGLGFAVELAGLILAGARIHVVMEEQDG
jgi:hypothetical protein